MPGMKPGINRLCLPCVLFCSFGVLAQSGITGDAQLYLVDGGLDCNGRAALLEVHIDITGLFGTGGELAGLNSFVLSFLFDRPEVLASVAPGTVPSLGWSLRTSDVVTNQVNLVGWVADQEAPNQNYLVATMLFSGSVGSVNVAFNRLQSSMGSRVTQDGDGPGPILIDGNGASFNLLIPIDFDLDLDQGVSLWLKENTQYALVNTPTGPIDMLDLVKLVNCGGR